MICSFGFTESFKISDNNIEKLFTLISILPEIKNKEQIKTLYLGASIKYVSLNKVLKLLHLSYLKINLIFDESILEELMIAD